MNLGLLIMLTSPHSKPPSPVQEFSIDGHDGAAKTPIAEGVKAQLEASGLRVKLCAPFHLANDCVPGGEIYPYWETDEKAQEAIDLLKNLIANFRRECQEEKIDVALYDRHWMTVFAEIEGRPTQAHWTNFVPTFFIEAPPEKTTACSRFSLEIPWTTSIDQVERYYHRYLLLAQRYPKHIVDRFTVTDKRQPLTPIIDAICTHILTSRKT